MNGITAPLRRDLIKLIEMSIADNRKTADVLQAAWELLRSADRLDHVTKCPSYELRRPKR